MAQQNLIEIRNKHVTLFAFPLSYTLVWYPQRAPPYLGKQENIPQLLHYWFFIRIMRLFWTEDSAGDWGLPLPSG